MTQTRLWIAAGIIAAVILGGFVLSVPHTTEMRPQASSSPAPVPPVSVRDAYKKGVHTLSVSVTAPDACTLVTANASVTGGTSSPAILVAVSMPPTSGICLELPTVVPFKLTVAAPAHAPISATVNGQPATTTP